MKLVATCKLVVSADEKPRLLATLERVNEACCWLAGRAFELRSADKIRLQRLHYRELRERFGLMAQQACLVISKVCGAYRRDKSKLAQFRPHGAIALDQRLYTFKHGLDRVSISTLDGRLVLPVIIGDYHRGRLEGARGQADLIYRKGKFFLYVSVEVPDGSPIDPKAWLGVDLGIRNIAVDSDNEPHTGETVESVRQRCLSLRSRLQAVGTKSAKRHLRKVSGKEARFRSIENHRISKRIVSKSKGTGRGIALEDLHGIRNRTTVRKAQRAQHAGWAFYQLRQFIGYKALLAGVPVRIVDPRDTSRTCPLCGNIDKANRRSQSEFCCRRCGYAANADFVGATNIRRRAEVNQPMVSSYCGGEHLSSASVQEQSPSL
jgi:putative transposase